MLTTAQLITKVRRLLAYNLDATPSLDMDGNPVDTTDADIVQSINEAQDRLAVLCPLMDPAMAFTLPVVSSGPCLIDMSAAGSRRVWQVLDVCLNGLMLRSKIGFGKTGAWSMAEMEDSFPQWRTDAPSIPRLWSKVSDRQIILYPAPDSGQPAINNFVSVYYLPAPLDSTVPSGVSQLPEELHEWIAKMAAAIEAEAVASEGQQAQVIQLWEQGATNAAEMLGKALRAARSPFGTTSGRNKPNYMRV